jgi:hypothetical protein
MSQMISISDTFRELIVKVEEALIADATVNFGFPKKLYFRHGNLMEIEKQLVDLSNSPADKNKKFPLFVLFRDIKEKLDEERFGFNTSFPCKFGIFTLTEQEYNSDQREEKTFKPVLRPILKEVINQIQLSSTFGMPNSKSLNIQKSDCFFYGSVLNNKNQFSNKVDAIEASINVTIHNKC